MSYIDDHRASGFQVGDTVRVFARCSSYAGGWNNTWSIGMETDTSSRICGDHGDRGFRLDAGFSYPWFVLEKINE